ncbi:MAG: PilZ domain-containing protein [Nitrospirae bacterium]|nr:PilZ domain-containing protein [Nitrospirota bacterium]MBI3594968.1 PilZ domain-containing protein [Nitrospirota bacterium]
MYVRRKFPRFSVSGVVELTTSEKKISLSGMIEKISQGGIGVYCNQKIARGTRISMEVIMFTGPDTSIYPLTGVVQNFEKMGDSGLLGIQFDQIINEKDQPELTIYLSLLEKQYSKYKNVL